VNSRANTRGRRRSPPDLVLPRPVRDRLVPLAPFVTIVSLVALGVAQVADLSGPISFGLLAVACGATLVMLSEQHSLRHELRRARVNAVDAIDLERLRIQDDLHDSVQQRLVSVRIRLDDLAQDTWREELREAVGQLGSELDATLADIRSITLSSTPHVLLRRGLRDALRAVAAYSPLRVTLEAPPVRRYPVDIERCVYYCCLEALQNVAKHAGRSARAWVRLTELPDRLVFEVEDSGVGFDLGSMRPGRGMASITDRVGALGGRVGIDTRPGFGTRIRGEVPLAA
jgi:signal transduction histidine kinase